MWDTTRYKDCSAFEISRDMAWSLWERPSFLFKEEEGREDKSQGDPQKRR
jgi:hypothetical protein